MKKYYILFFVFVLAFAAAMIFVYTWANPSVVVPGTELSTNRSFEIENGSLEWHGKVENEYGTYTGTLINDLFQGKGRFSFLSGESYAGEWQNSFMSGNGVMVFPDVGEYSGEMDGSARNGTGIFKWKTGEVYEGSWVEDEMSGDGRYVFSDGSIFKGVLAHNKPVSGTYIYQPKSEDSSNDTEIVSLIYKFSEKEKYIIVTTNTGLKYDGDPSGLSEKGIATVTYPSGNVYYGELSEGLRNGAGKYTWNDPSGSAIAYYEGNWVKDHMSGKGKYHYSANEYPYIEGYFENDTPSGTLTYYKEKNNTFETVWKNGTCISVKET